MSAVGKCGHAFLRTTESPWQEGHTAHASYEEAEEVNIKNDSCLTNDREDYLASRFVAEKQNRKVCWRSHTYCIEALMQDAKHFNQAPSLFGQNFAKPLM
jgi:prolyl-tRNA synthetase